MPRARGFDSTWALLRDPYRFISLESRRLGTDAFETRLLLQRTVCLTGPAAAELFYDPYRFERQGAAPGLLLATLFGHGGVQGLDGAAHRHRKALFQATTDPAHVRGLVEQARVAWLEALPQWADAGTVSLYRALQPVLTRAVCRWAGVPLPEAHLHRRTAQLTALFDTAASGLVQHLWSRWARWQTEAWLMDLIRRARNGEPVFSPGTPADAVVRHRDLGGQLLQPRVAAVELLNLLRPTVAVSVFIAFAAQALARWPDRAEALVRSSDAGDALAFVQEVRRHCPFFPAVVARVKRNFEWQGLPFVAGHRAVLDLYGTNHDPRTWSDPDIFRPERWRQQTPTRFEFVPQGGARAASHHRCPGEDVTVHLMLLALDMLLHRMAYGVAPASLATRMTRLPAVPVGGVRMIHVRLR